MQMIAGTVKNAVKLDVLTKNWEQKKSNSHMLLMQEKNERANMSPEQRRIEQFKEELARNREQGKNNAIANKIMNGEDLTLDEEKYLAQNNPGQLNNYRRAKAERQAYEEKLKNCKTKDEVQRLKTNTMNSYLAELKGAPGEAKSAKAMEILGKVRNILKAELHFIESGGYALLPSEADEAKDRAKERSRENENALEIIKESLENNDENIDYTDERATSIDENAVEDAEQSDKEIIQDEKKTAFKKKETDPVEEIENICKRYIPNVDGETETTRLLKETKPKDNKQSSTIDVTL